MTEDRRVDPREAEMIAAVSRRLPLPFDRSLREATRALVEAEAGAYCGEAPGPTPRQAADAFLALLPPELASTVRLGGAEELRRRRTSDVNVWGVVVRLRSGEDVRVGTVGSRSFAALSLAARGLGLGEFWSGAVETGEEGEP